MDTLVTPLIQTMGQAAKKAARKIAVASCAEKNQALHAIADAIWARRSHIQTANAADVQRARANGLSGAYLDRLTLNDARIEAMVNGIRQIAGLADSVGEITAMRSNAKGLQVGRMRVPLGVVGIIYESRPNVTADAAALCLKSGNAAILRGGSEAIESNRCIMAAIHAGLAETALPQETVQLVSDCSRAHVAGLLAADTYLDVVIPRGGRGLVALVAESARMPVIKHLEGLCHIYVDKAADLEKALRICDNGKTYRYGICGATETLLIHQATAERFLPRIAAVYQAKGVEMRGCPQTCAILGGQVLPADETDWATEYLAAIISIKVVADYEEAVNHIARYGSKHTDAIVSEDLQAVQRFLREVDSASVMVNTPTCFADGYEYGLGAEIGISTDKIHWRGPVGVEGLTCQKFIVISDGVIR